MNNGTTIRELSSVGSERLPYKQRVGGSTPSAPTKKDLFRIPEEVFFYVYAHPNVMASRGASPKRIKH